MQWTTALVLVEFLLTLKRLKCPAVPLIEVQIRGYWSLSSDAGPNDFATFSNLTVNVRCVWGSIQCLVNHCSLSHMCVHFKKSDLPGYKINDTPMGTRPKIGIAISYIHNIF